MHISLIVCIVIQVILVGLGFLFWIAPVNEKYSEKVRRIKKLQLRIYSIGMFVLTAAVGIPEAAIVMDNQKLMNIGIGACVVVLFLIVTLTNAEIPHE